MSWILVVESWPLYGPWGADYFDSTGKRRFASKAWAVKVADSMKRYGNQVRVEKEKA